jgi:hypothetical protein
MDGHPEERPKRRGVRSSFEADTDSCDLVLAGLPVNAGATMPWGVVDLVDRCVPACPGIG